MSKTLKVVSWNVNYPRFAKDNSYVIQTLESLSQPDVICLQEYVQGKDADAIEWFERNSYDMAYLPFAHNLDGLSQGVMTANKKTLHAQVDPVVLREDVPRRFRPFPNIRGLLSAQIKIGDHLVTIANFHSTYPRPHVMDMRKREFAELMKFLVAKDAQHPWLLCGDFNFFGRDSRKKLLKHRYKSFTGNIIQPTWRHHNRLSPVRLNLDYFFWNGLSVKAKLAPFSNSDHRPLTATVSLN